MYQYQGIREQFAPLYYPLEYNSNDLRSLNYGTIF